MVYLYTLLTIALLYLVYFVLIWVLKKGNTSDILILTSALCFSILSGLQIYLSIEEQADVLFPQFSVISNWMHVSALASILTGMGLAIREAKPIINRAPAALSFIPFLLILVHPLIQDTVIVKELLFGLYAVAAIVIALMLFTLAYVRRGEYGYLLTGTIIILLGFILIHTPSNVLSFGYLIGILLCGMGILSIALHYRKQVNNLVTN